MHGRLGMIGRKAVGPSFRTPPVTNYAALWFYRGSMALDARPWGSRLSNGGYAHALDFDKIWQLRCFGQYFMNILIPDVAKILVPLPNGDE